MAWFSRKRSLILQRRITLEQLEERIVLDAAGAVTAQENPDQTDAAQTQPGQDAAQGAAVQTPAVVPAPPPDSGASGQPVTQALQPDLKVVLVSNALGQIDAIQQAAGPNAKVVVVDDASDTIGSVLSNVEALSESSGRMISGIALLGHGEPGALNIGKDVLDFFNLAEHRDAFESLADNLTSDAQIQLYGCNLAEDALGQALVQRIAMYTGAEVFASKDVTGGVVNDWSLEYGSNAAVPMVSVLHVDALSELHEQLGAKLASNMYTDNRDSHDLITFQMAVMNGILYFATDDGIHGRELWQSDGTASGTKLVYDICAIEDPVGSGKTKSAIQDNYYYQRSFQACDGKLFFFAAPAGADRSAKCELWVHDPQDTISPTKKVSDFGTRAFDWQMWVNDGTNLYFTVRGGSQEGLHKLNTTTFADTVVNNSYDITFVTGPYGGETENVVVHDGKLYFTHQSWPTAKGSLIEYDPDAPAGRQFTEVWTTPEGNGGYSAKVVSALGKIFFDNHVYIPSGPYTGTDYGWDLWAYDPVTKSSAKLWDSSDQRDNGTYPDLRTPNGLVAGDHYVYFAAGLTGENLWRTDGTVSGTEHLTQGIVKANILWQDPYSYHGQERLWAVVGDTLVTQAQPMPNPDGSIPPKTMGIWATDGTSDGTVQIDSWTKWGTWTGIGFHSPTPLGDTIFYGLLDEADTGYGWNIWRTDGTVNHTVLAADLDQRTSSDATNYPGFFTTVADKLLFFVNQRVDVSDPKSAWNHQVWMWTVEGPPKANSTTPTIAWDSIDWTSPILDLGTVFTVTQGDAADLELTVRATHGLTLIEAPTVSAGNTSTITTTSPMEFTIHCMDSEINDRLTSLTGTLDPAGGGYATIDFILTDSLGNTTTSTMTLGTPTGPSTTPTTTTATPTTTPTTTTAAPTTTTADVALSADLAILNFWREDYGLSAGENQELFGTVGRVTMFWNAWDEGSATEVFERGSSRTKETVFALGDFLNLAGLGDGDVQVEVAWGDGAHGGDFQVVGLYGYDDVIQEGGILLFNLDEINVAGLLDEYTDLETSDVKLASLDDWADNEDWLRMVESCRGKCTGTVGFLDMLLQSKPGGMKGMGANTI